MKRYSINEATFVFPRGLIDKSLNIFTLPGKGPSDFSIVITRDPIPSGMTLLRYTERQIIEMESKFSKFQLLSREDSRLGRMDAVVLQFSWVSQGVKTLQRQAVAFVPAEEAQQALIVTGTARESFGAWAAVFDEFLATFEIH